MTIEATDNRADSNFTCDITPIVFISYYFVSSCTKDLGSSTRVNDWNVKKEIEKELG